MKYIIIGIVTVYIIVPYLIALYVSDSVGDILKELREAYKTFVPAITLAIVAVAALVLIVYGLVNLVEG